MNTLQGEIYLVNPKNTTGSEQKGIRPAVVISGDEFNKIAAVVITCPFTTSLKNYYGGSIIEPNKTNGLKKTSEVLVAHTSSISKKRLKKRIGRLSRQEVYKIIYGLNELLMH